MSRRRDDDKRRDNTGHEKLRDVSRHVDKPAPLSARSTFRAAQARRVLADSLPDVVYRKDAPRPSVMRDEKPCLGCAQEAAKASVASPRQMARRDDLTPDHPPITLRKEVETCKDKPSGKRKPGGGSGRPFVPWCSKKR